MISSSESSPSPSTIVSERESLQQERLTRQYPSTIPFDRESLRRERLNRRSKTNCWQRDNNDQVKGYKDIALTAHSSDANMAPDSNIEAQLADLERKLLNLFRETDDASSSDNKLLIEGLISDIQSVAFEILTTGRPLIQYYYEQNNYEQIEAHRLRYNPLITERADQAQQRLTDRLHFLTEAPEGKMLVKLRSLKFDLLSFISQAEVAL